MLFSDIEWFFNEVNWISDGKFMRLTVYDDGIFSRKPISVLTKQGLWTKHYKELIGISTDTVLRDKYKIISLITVWPGLNEEFPCI